MRLAKHLGILTIGLFASCTLFSCSPNVKEQETTKPETSYVLQYQENKKIEEQKAWEVLIREGASIVKGYKERHDKSIDQTGVGIFYGNMSNYSTALTKYNLKPNQALAYSKLLLDQELFSKEITVSEEIALEKAIAEEPVSKPGFKLPIMTDCLDWCVLNLKEAYKKSGMEKDWLNIQEKALEKSRNAPTLRYYGKNGMIGIGLAKTLVEDGWTCIYYNPDTNLPGDKPAYIPEEPLDKKSIDYKIWWRHHMLWTEHPASYDNVKKYGDYYGIPVTDLLVDYRPTTELINEYDMTSRWMENEDPDKGEEHYKEPVTSPTIKKTDKIEQLKKVPFGFLLTRGGNHCAMLSYGKVYEVHRSFGPKEKNLIEVKDFETKWDWLSGVIIVPP